MPEVCSMNTISWRTRKKFWLNCTDHHTSINEDFTLGHWSPPLLLTVPAWRFSEISLAIQASEPSHSCLVLLSNSITLWDKKICGLLFTCRAGCVILQPAKTECTGTSPGADTSSMLRQQSGSVPYSFYYGFLKCLGHEVSHCFTE